MQEYIVRVYEDRTEWRDIKLGHLHREGGPALECVDGYKEWLINGIRHNLDGPALVTATGHKRWFIYGIERSETEFLAKTQTKELTVAEIEKLLGYSIKIIKGE